MSEKKVLRNSLSEQPAENDFVKIYVGPERKLWTIHERLLCERIPFFKAAFMGNFKEITEKSIDLPEDCPAAFGQLVKWVYAGWIFCDCHNWDGLDGKELEEKGNPMTPDHEMLWCSLWVLAEKMGNKDLVGSTYDRFVNCLDGRRSNKTIYPQTIAFVYTHTVETSHLRKLIVEEFTRRYYVECKSKEDKAKLLRDLAVNEEFGVDVLEHIESHHEEEECIYGIYEDEECFCHKKR